MQNEGEEYREVNGEDGEAHWSSNFSGKPRGGETSEVKFHQRERLDRGKRWEWVEGYREFRLSIGANPYFRDFDILVCLWRLGRCN